MTVIDASVYVALLKRDERDHARSRAWFGEAAPVAAPNIILAEVAAAISRGTGDEDRALREVEALERDGLVDLIPVSDQLAGRAARLAAEHQVRGCDAVYVALAEQLGDDLVTLDRQQLERGGAVVRTREPPPEQGAPSEQGSAQE